jgi:hypothetical protein
MTKLLDPSSLGTYCEKIHRHLGNKATEKGTHLVSSKRASNNCSIRQLGGVIGVGGEQSLKQGHGRVIYHTKLAPSVCANVLDYICSWYVVARSKSIPLTI